MAAIRLSLKPSAIFWCLVSLTSIMKPRTSEGLHRRSRNHEAPNWILIAWGSVLSMLSVRLGYKLKEANGAKEVDKSTQSSTDVNNWKKSGGCSWHSDDFCLAQEENDSYNCCDGSSNVIGIKQQRNAKMPTDPLVIVPTALGSNSSCVSECGSDILIKRDVIKKLRLQLKRRDDTILEMQDQITGLQISFSSQLLFSSHLQSMLDAAHGDLFDSEMEIQRLRNVIADHCVGVINSRKLREKEIAKIGMLDSQVIELEELIEGKDYLLQSYKEQKLELSTKIKQLQQQLDSQLLNTL